MTSNTQQQTTNEERFAESENSHAATMVDDEAKLEEKKYKQTELRIKLWDLGVKVLVPIVTVIVGVLQFTTQQTKLEELRFKSEHWLKRFDAYTRLTNSIATVNIELMYSKSNDELRKHINTFEILYWESLLVEDPTLRPVLNSYKDDLDKLRLLSKQNSDSTALGTVRTAALQDGYDVIQKCKESINKYLPADIENKKGSEK